MNRFGLGAVAAAMLLVGAGDAQAKDAQGKKQDQGQTRDRSVELLDNDVPDAQIRDVGPKNAQLGDSFDTGVQGARELEAQQPSADLGATWKEGVDGARTREIGPTVQMEPERRTGQMQQGEQQRAAQPAQPGDSDEVQQQPSQQEQEPLPGDALPPASP